MPANIPLPDTTKVKTLLEVLFDGLEVKAQPKPAAPADGGWFGLFVLDDGSPVALCGTDAALSAGIGAALSMLPPAAAKEAAASRKLDEVMLANLREVMNICSRLLMEADSPHLKLEQTYGAKLLPAGAAQLASAPRSRAEFQLTVPKYGAGTMSFLVGG